MRLTITASSAALFSTWFFVEELGLLFDAGDGVSATLCQNAGKVRQVFVSHADRDHVAGLLQLHQLNARDGSPLICFPRDCGSFPALREFMAKFDPQSGPATWRGLVPGDDVDIGGHVSVLAGSSNHIGSPAGQVKALRFVVRHHKRTLRTEHHGRSGPEIQQLKQTLGVEAVTQEVTESLLGYTGDAAGLEPSDWPGVPVLIHECTFLAPGMARRAHSNVVEVLAAARGMPLQGLILAHFSPRFTAQEIREAVEQESQRNALPFKVHVVWPGEVCRDVLNLPPVWAGI